MYFIDFRLFIKYKPILYFTELKKISLLIINFEIFLLIPQNGFIPRSLLPRRSRAQQGKSADFLLLPNGVSATKKIRRFSVAAVGFFIWFDCLQIIIIKHYKYWTYTAQYSFSSTQPSFSAPRAMKPLASIQAIAQLYGRQLAAFPLRFSQASRAAYLL